MKDKLILIGDVLLAIVLFNAIKSGSFFIVAGVLCVLAIDIKRRFYPSSKYVYWIFGMILLVIIGSVADIGLSHPKTNTDAKYSQIENTLYQNTAYNFSVDFPDGWKISARGSGDSQAVVQKATKGSAFISIAVRDVPTIAGTLSPESNTIENIVEFEKFKQQTKIDMEKALPGVKNFEFKQTLIDQVPAYWVKFSGPNMIGDKTSEDTVEQYQFFYKNVLYMISTTANSNDFSSVKKEFDETINHFKITK